MNIIIILLFIMHLVAVRIVFRYSNQVINSYRSWRHNTKREYKDRYYEGFTSALPPGVSELEWEQKKAEAYYNLIQADKDIFYAEILFLLYYACASLLSLFTALYLLKIIA